MYVPLALDIYLTWVSGVIVSISVAVEPTHAQITFFHVAVRVAGVFRAARGTRGEGDNYESHGKGLVKKLHVAELCNLRV